MADRNRNPFAEDQLKGEATDWFLRMQEPDADAHRAAFERWLARGAMHRAAYNRIANLYLATEKVDWENIPVTPRVKAARRRAGFLIVGFALLVAFIVWRILYSPAGGVDPLVANGVVAGQTRSAAQIVTRLGEIRTVRLADGSRVTLDTDTLVSIDYRSARRLLRLEHGRARFDVAHERRPFVVDAGDSEVVARGTMFDVSVLDRDKVHVQLLRGLVDIERPASPGRHDRIAIASLRPGQGVSYAIPADCRIIARPRPDRDPASDWPTGSIDFSASTLGEVVATANRYSTTKLRLADSRMASIPVSGVFRVNDTGKLATSLSFLLNLEAIREPDQITFVRREK